MDTPLLLVADQNQRFLEKCEDILCEAGYSMIPALDGVQAKEILATKPLTGVIAHVDLPEVGGVELCQFIKREYPAVPVVVMSAEDSRGVAIAEEAGAENVLFRPVKRSELLFCARTLIRAYDINRAFLARIEKYKKEGRGSPSSHASRLSHLEFFKAFLSVEVKRARRYNFPLSLMLTSLDSKGELEKQHGKKVVQKLLIGLARAVRLSVRDIDIPVTLRDDTILVLMPHTDKEGALVVSQRVNKRIRHSVYREGSIEIRPTISIGETTYDSKRDRNFGQVVRRASEAMRDARLKGGDQVVVK